MSSNPHDTAHQDRWNRYGVQRCRQIQHHPERFLITACPIGHKVFSDELLKRLSPLTGKKILELGSGRGEFAVWLAQQGAQVTAMDVGPDLVIASQALAEINHTTVDFITGSIVSPPFHNETFDVIVGLAVLHHLSETDVKETLRQCHRLLKPEGRAVFHETVENSPMFDTLQNIFPVGKKGEPYYRPSILQRRAWKQYQQAHDDRAMTNREFTSGAQGLFHTTTITPYGFLVRLVRFFGKKQRQRLQGMDRFLFNACPPLKRFCQTVLVTYYK